MKVLIMNPILYTAETDNIPKILSIKDTMIYALCMGFIKNGDEPVLVAADNYKPLQEEDYPFQILWFPCVFPRLCKPRCLPLLRGLGSYIKQHSREYDYIISSEVFSLLTLSGVLRAKKKMIIWHELGAHNNLMKKLPSKCWYNIVARLFMQNVPVIPRSDKAAEFISKYCNQVLPIRIDHGVDLDKIVCDDDKENYFVVLSQLIERKHIDGIINSFTAFRRAGEGQDGYKLKIIGDGELRSKLQQQVKESGEEANIQFLGKMDHKGLMPVLARAKALLINTSKDNSMVSIVESIAAGTPIVTTSVPFNSVYIKREKLGIVKDNWDQAELEKICDENDLYVTNCMKYRERLSNVYFAKEFDKVGGALNR